MTGKNDLQKINYDLEEFSKHQFDEGFEISLDLCRKAVKAAPDIVVNWKKLILQWTEELTGRKKYNPQIIEEGLRNGTDIPEECVLNWREIRKVTVQRARKLHKLHSSPVVQSLAKDIDRDNDEIIDAMYEFLQAQSKQSLEQFVAANKETSPTQPQDNLLTLED